MGSPTTTSIEPGVNTRDPFGRIFLLPLTVTGRMGKPLSTAVVNPPLFEGLNRAVGRSRPLGKKEDTDTGGETTNTLADAPRRTIPVGPVYEDIL